MEKRIIQKTSAFMLTVLIFIFYPAGVYRVWKKDFRPIWIRWVYTILGLPLFIVMYAFAWTTIFASLLPEPDRAIGMILA